jgi:hypothetical protein
VIHLAGLHALRVAGLLPGEQVPGAGALVVQGLVADTPAGLVLTDTGHARHAELLDAERAGADLDAVAAAYERFLALNGPVKALCSRWQRLGDGGLAERAVVLDELAELHERLEPVLRRTVAALPRFAGYHDALGAALEHARDGDRRWVTDPQIASYHSVWFRLHEDYLVTLGRDRQAEGSY